MKLSPNFSHIYIEENAIPYKWTQHILTRFPKAAVIHISDYKEVFTRSGQNFRLQKESMKLILAVKKDRFLYPGSPNAQNFGLTNFYYNALILNCLYDCTYCYLQGMYTSGNPLLFVNLEDYFTATSQALHRREDPYSPLYLAISYDTDLLAFESIIPYCREWVQFARNTPELLIEIRTKSANFGSIRDLEPTDQVVLAWTLSPSIATRTYEKGAPPLLHRLEAAKRAIDNGWQVRLCFDPVLRTENWLEHYSACIEETFKVIAANSIHDVTIGGFRVSADHFKEMRSVRHDSALLYYPYKRKGNIVSYSENENSEINKFMIEKLKMYIPKDRIAAWTSL